MFPCMDFQASTLDGPHKIVAFIASWHQVHDMCPHKSIPPHVLLPGVRSRLPSTSSCLLTSKCSSNFCNRILECRKCNKILDEGNATEYWMKEIQLYLQEKKNQPAPEVGIFTFTMPQSEPLGPSHWNDN